MLKGVVAALAATLITASAHAQLVDRGRVLFDPATNLEWLKLDATRGVSFQQAVLRTAIGGDLAGWELASRSQVRDLFDALVGPPTGYAGSLMKCDIDACLLHTTAEQVVLRSWVQPVFDAFGVLEYWRTPWNVMGKPWATSNLFGVFAEPHTVAFISNGHNFGYDAGALDEGIVFAQPELAGQGAFLVRSAIPEPANAALFMIGLAVLTLRRRPFSCRCPCM